MPRKSRISRMRSSQAAISSTRRRAISGPTASRRRRAQLAERHGASFTSIVGDDLLKQNFPMIHAVGRASATPPRLIDFTWGKADAPRVTLVGKGVAFDTGGLDIKPASSMLLMRKDMGGAAATLALASMIMDAKLPVRLRVLIPAVENSISSNAFRPGDILCQPQGHLGRDRQHGCGRTAHPGRRPGARRRGEPRPHRRFRHAHRCGPRGARPRAAALLHR